MKALRAIQVFAVIPAAGQSTRMGRPKQLLPLDGRTMLESVVETVLHGDIDGLCVVTTNAVDAELALSEDPRFITAINDDPRTQMLDSVLIGLEVLRKHCAIEADDGVLVCPGDAAGVVANDVKAVCRAYRQRPGALVTAASAGKRGHPMVFPASLQPEARAIPQGGLKTLLDRHSDQVCTVERASAGVLEDIDTPEDYSRLADGDAGWFENPSSNPERGNPFPAE